MILILLMICTWLQSSVTHTDAAASFLKYHTDIFSIFAVHDRVELRLV